MAPASRFRIAGLLLLILSLAAVLVGGVAMARRVAEANRHSARELYVFQPVNERSFAYAGRPVEITDEVDESGNERISVRYGDEGIRLRPGIPPGPAQLPGLARHGDWLRVLRFAPRRGMSFEDLQAAIAAGEIADRLAIVTRTPPPGADPRTRGQVARREWVFDFYEFLPEGGFESQRLRYPESERSFRKRQRQARDAGRPVPERRRDELKEGTWQFDAALLVMPPLGAPSPRFEGDPVEAMGWTLPVTGMSVLGVVIAVVILAGGKRTANNEQRKWAEGARHQGR